jgi:hypothetical protein
MTAARQNALLHELSKIVADETLPSAFTRPAL